MPQITEVAWDMNREGLREDLKLFPYAVELGFKAFVPESIYGVHARHQNALTFVKGEEEYSEGSVHIWLVMRVQWAYGNKPSDVIAWWQAADVIDRKFQNHRKYETLKEALEAESGN